MNARCIRTTEELIAAHAMAGCEIIVAADGFTFIKPAGASRWRDGGWTRTYGCDPWTFRRRR